MCLAVPMRLVEICGNLGTVELEGVRRTVSLDLLEGPAVGDYVIVHAGFAIERLDPGEARKTLDLFRELEGAAGGP